jgi:hypothetical protein
MEWSRVVANRAQEEERPLAKLEGQHRYKKDTGTEEIHDAFPFVLFISLRWENLLEIGAAGG